MPTKQARRGRCIQSAMRFNSLCTCGLSRPVRCADLTSISAFHALRWHCLTFAHTLEASQVFGENALLGALLGAATDPPRARSLTATCTQPTEVLKLSKADFDVGFLGRDQPIGTPDEQLAAIEMLLGPGSVDPATIEEAMRRSARETLLRFIQMVTGSHAVGTYRRGEAVFRAGDTVDKLYIVSSGRCAISTDLPPPSMPLADRSFGQVSSARARGGGKGGSRHTGRGRGCRGRDASGGRDGRRHSW